MTTIAYKSGVIAYDSRIVRGDYVLSDHSSKKYETDNYIFFLSGSCDEYQIFIDMFEGRKKKPEWESDVTALVWGKESGKVLSAGTFKRDGIISTYHNEVKCHQAIGSGSKWAIAAMDFGEPAKKAVEYAATRDIYTGGVITEFIIPKDGKKEG